MGGIGRCCCAECDCLAVEDLPAVTISGYTGGGWSGTCCYEQTFTPNTAQSWSKSCSGMIYESTVAEQCVTEHYRSLEPEYPGFVQRPLDVGNGCEDLPEDYCCPQGFEKIATSTTDWTFTDNAFMAVWRKIKHIIVRISQEDVDCSGVEGQTGGCKIVIRSRFVYDYAATYYRNALNTYAQSVVMHNTTCFAVNPDFQITANTPTAITCSDVPANPPTGDNCLASGTFYFDRVRYYDEMPTGSITFNNTHVPGCTSTACDYSPLNYTSSVCIYSPATPIVSAFGCYLNEPCYCTDEVFATNNTPQYGPIICGGDNIFIQAVTGCFDEPCEVCATLITECDGVTEYQCPDSSFSTSCLYYDIDPENPATCFRDGIGSGVNNACACYATLTGNFIPTAPYTQTVFCNDPTNCNSQCCQSLNDYCTCCYPDGVCYPKYGLIYFGTIASHTRTQTCSGFQSKSVCTTAPSWTITLA